MIFWKIFIGVFTEVLVSSRIRGFAPLGSLLGSEPMGIVKITKGFEFSAQCLNAPMPPMPRCPGAPVPSFQSGLPDLCQDLSSKWLAPSRKKNYSLDSDERRGHPAGSVRTCIFKDDVVFTLILFFLLY